MKGFGSESNVPSLWPDRPFFVQHLLEVPHCLTRIAEFLHTLLVQPRLLSQLRSIWLCTFPSSRFEMTENHFWASAHLPHPFKPNEFVQMFWEEQRQPGVWGTGAPVLLGVSLVVRPARPQQTFLAQQLPRCLLPPEDGILRPMRTATTKVPAPAANGSSRLGSRAALSHRHHRMTGCRRPRQLACHQTSSRSPSLMLTVRLLAAHCGFALATLLLAIAKTTGTGWMLGAPNSPARQAGTPLSFLTRLSGTGSRIPGSVPSSFFSSAPTDQRRISPLVAAFSHANVPWPTSGVTPLWDPGGEPHGCMWPECCGFVGLVASV